MANKSSEDVGSSFINGFVKILHGVQQNGGSEKAAETNLPCHNYRTRPFAMVYFGRVVHCVTVLRPMKFRLNRLSGLVNN